MKKSHEYRIEFKESFHIRRPVLAAMLNENRWEISPDGSKLLLDLPLNNYSTHQKDIIEFALDPNEMPKGIFSGLDQPVADKLTIAISELFGRGGFYARKT